MAPLVNCASGGVLDESPADDGFLVNDGGVDVGDSEMMDVLDVIVAAGVAVVGVEASTSELDEYDRSMDLGALSSTNPDWRYAK